MHDRTERIVTALLDDIKRGVMLARLHGREPREAQPVESFARDRDVRPALRPTHFDCRIEIPIARREGTEAEDFETIKLWGELDASGAVLVQGIEVEPRVSP
jgi:hypothetical protein